MKKATISIVVGVAAATMGLASPASATLPSDSTPCTARSITAHEGYKANADGDTVESQVAAWEIGANAADTDIWKTSDNYFVERHDNDLSTSTDAPPGTLITNSTLAQVQSYTTTQHHERIPLVSDSLALTQLNQPYRSLQMETKWSMNGQWALKMLDDQIVAAGMQEHVIIYSAYLPQLQYLASIDPTLTLWYKAGQPPPVTDLQGLDGVMLSASVVTRKNVRMYHDAGYTVTRGRVLDNENTWNHFVKKKEDAMMTDEPALMVGYCRTI